MATIKIKRSTTANAVGPNTEGEISTNLTDKKLFIGTGSAVLTFPDQTQITQEISTAIGGLSSAFEYKGTLSGNGDAYAAGGSTTTATNLPASPEVGDYYKVIAKGYFSDGTNEYFVNVGDAIVHNNASSGASWDVLDNTNSTVTAESGADIEVTGSTETGFVVGFSSTAALDQSTQSVDGGTY
jgi:hypothetical protein